MRSAIALMALLALVGMGMPACAEEKSYPDPKRFEKDIAAFEAMDKEQPPPRGAIVCIGSSSMRGWHSWIRQDLSPLTVIPRGFGGSDMLDAAYFADRIVIPYSPRAILLYEGDNDIAAGISPEKVRDTFREFVSKVRRSLPSVRIYVLSIKPSPSRWALWPKMQEANRLLAEECSRGKRLTYVDITPGMLDAVGQPHADIFLADNLHMNRKGYQAWKEIVKPALMKAERQYETPDAAVKQFPIGVWYEGGVGEFRDNLIPDDPAKASAVYNRDFADIAAHGLNAAVVPNSRLSHNGVMLDAARAHDLKLIVELDKEGGELGDIIRGATPPSDENIREALDAKLKPIMSHPALLGVQLLDEPWPPFDRYAKVYSAFKAYAPSLLAFTCLPGPAGVKEFVETVKPEVVAYDDYPIRTTPVVIKDPMMKLEESLRAVSTEAAKQGTPVWSVLQAHAIDGYHPFPTPAQIRCQTYLSLANGCRGIWYFMYQTECFSKSPRQVMYGLVDADFKGDERWEEVRVLASEIKALAPTLLDLTISDSPKVECSSVAHVLRDSCGEVYVAVVNTDTLDSRKVTVKLDASGMAKRGSSVVRLPSGRAVKSTLENGALTWTDTLARGDGAFYRVR